MIDFLAQALPLPPAPLDLPPGADLTTGIDAIDTASRLSSIAANETWNAFVHGPVFKTVALFAIPLAGLLVLFSGLEIAKRSFNEPYHLLERFLILFFLALFLSPNTGLLARTLDGVRAVGNFSNSELLRVVNTDLKVSQQLAIMSNYQRLRTEISQLDRECDSVTRVDEYRKCRENTIAKARQKLDSITIADTSGRWIENLRRAVNAIASNPIQAVGDGAGAIENGVVRIAETPILWAAQALITAIHAGAQSFIEISLAITALISPIMIALAFMPQGLRALTVWISGFLGLFIWKASLNLLTAAIATQAFYQGSAELLSISIEFVLAVFISFALARGGGFAIFASLTAVLGTTVSIATLGIVRFSK